MNDWTPESDAFARAQLPATKAEAVRLIDSILAMQAGGKTREELVNRATMSLVVESTRLARELLKP